MPRTGPASLSTRIAVGSVAFGLAGLLTAGAVLSGVFRANAEHNFDELLRDDVVHLSQSIAFAADGTFVLRTPLETDGYDVPGAAWAWQVSDGDRVVARSPSLAPGERLAVPDGPATDFTTADGRHMRGMADHRTITGYDGPVSVTVAGDRAVIDDEIAEFRAGLGWALLCLGVGFAAAQVVQARLGLAPLRRLGARVARMRQGEGAPDPDGWPAELVPLVRELAALETHNAALVERGRSRAADLAHALKTPLAVIQSLAEDLPQPAREDVLARTKRMSVAVKRHLGRARGGQRPTSRTDVRRTVDDLLLALGRVFESRGLAARNLVPPRLVFHGGQDDLDEMLGNLVDNAGKWARGMVVVTAEPQRGRIVIEVADDGPGIPDERRREALLRGRRLDESVPGQGIGLSITAEIAELCGGRIEIGRSTLGGALMRLELPGGIDTSPEPRRSPAPQPAAERAGDELAGRGRASSAA